MNGLRKSAVSKVRHSLGSLMVWGCILRFGIGRLHRCIGTVRHDSFFKGNHMGNIVFLIIINYYTRLTIINFLYGSWLLALTALKNVWQITSEQNIQIKSH